ncbi:hypothetical protein ABPG72_003699 [Tetrahymena utriculariae]
MKEKEVISQALKFVLQKALIQSLKIILGHLAKIQTSLFSKQSEASQTGAEIQSQLVLTMIELSRRRFYPLPQGFIKIAEIPIKKYVGESEEKYTWLPNTYVIRIEVSQGQVDKLYTFKFQKDQQQETLYSSFREDASLVTIDSFDKIYEKIHQKAIRPVIKAQSIIYDEPDLEGLQEISNQNQQYQQQPKEHKIKHKCIAFTNISFDKKDQFKQYLENTLNQLNIENYEVTILSQYITIIKSKQIRKIKEALNKFIKYNNQILTFTHKQDPLKFGFIKNVLTVKEIPNTENDDFIKLIQQLNFEHRLKENGDLVIYTSKNMRIVPEFYSKLRIIRVKQASQLKNQVMSEVHFIQELRHNFLQLDLRILIGRPIFNQNIKYFRYTQVSEIESQYLIDIINQIRYYQLFLMQEIDDSINENIKISLIIVSSLSLIATSFIIIFYIFNKSYLTFSFDLVLMLCISDFVYSLISFLRALIMLSSPGTVIGMTLCYIQGLMIQTSIISSYICSSSICYSLFQWIVREVQIFRVSAFRQYWTVNFLLPLASGAILCIFKLIGRLEPFPNTFCYISTGDEDKDQLLMLIFYYLSFCICFTLNCFLIVRILVHYNKKRNQFKIIKLKDILKMCLYPLGLFITWFPIIFTRILRYYGIDSQFMVQVGFVMDNMNGLLNAVFYYFLSINPTTCCISIKDIRPYRSDEQINTDTIQVSLNENKDDGQIKNKKQVEEDFARTESKLIMMSY